MKLLPNVKIDTAMAQLITQNALSVVDKIKLELAMFAADLFPNATVYINPQQQETKLPAVFVDIYEVAKQRKLKYTARYEVGFSLSYLPLATLSSTELHGALFKLQQHITDLENQAVQSVSGNVTDFIANLTGTIIAREKNVDDAPIIENADKIIEIPKIINHAEIT